MKLSILLSSLSLSLALSIPPLINNDNNSHDLVIPDQISASQQPLTNTLESEKDNSRPELVPVSTPTLRINHGTFIPANKSRTESPLLNGSYTFALQLEQSPYRLLERYSDELFALGLLLLVPITLMLVELAERVCRTLSVEEFPDRGRDMQRIGSLEKRAEWLLRRKEREIQAEKTRPWWKWSRY